MACVAPGARLALCSDQGRSGLRSTAAKNLLLARSAHQVRAADQQAIGAWGAARAEPEMAAVRREAAIQGQRPTVPAMPLDRSYP